MPQFLIVDDHPLLRRGLVDVLRSQWSDAVIHEADTAAGLFKQVQSCIPDLVILDLFLPDGHGLECLGHLRRKHPQLAVLILSMQDETAFGVRALDLGAMGYLAKERAATELLCAVARILGGRRYVGPDLGEVLATRMEGSAVSGHERLSEREFRVLLALAAGQGPAAIGQHLCLSPKTITTYRARILSKLGLRTNADLVRYCLEQGLQH